MSSGQVVQQAVNAVWIFDDGRAVNEAVIILTMIDIDRSAQASQQPRTLCNYAQALIRVRVFVPGNTLGMLSPQGAQ